MYKTEINGEHINSNIHVIITKYEHEQPFCRSFSGETYIIIPQSKVQISEGT